MRRGWRRRSAVGVGRIAGGAVELVGRRRRSGRPRRSRRCHSLGQRQVVVKTANSPLGVTWKSAVSRVFGFLDRVEHDGSSGLSVAMKRGGSGAGEVEVGLVLRCRWRGRRAALGRGSRSSRLRRPPRRRRRSRPRRSLRSAPTVFQCVPFAFETGSQESVLPVPSVPVEIRVRVAASLRRLRPHRCRRLCRCLGWRRCERVLVVKKTLEPSSVIPSKRTPSVAPG